MATATVNFGANTALTVTNLQSLADGSYWQSAAIDNGTIKGFWAEVFVTIVTTTTAAADALGSIDLFMASSVDGGVDFQGGASGTEGSYAITGNNDEKHLDLVRSFSCDAIEVVARTYKYRAVLHNLAEDFALIIANQSGAALAAAGCAVEYRIHKYDSA